MTPGAASMVGISGTKGGDVMTTANTKLNLKPGAMTPEQVASLRDGSKVQFNLDVHMDHGANPKTWGNPTEIRIKSRGVTADCHPLGGGLPFVQYEYVLSRDESGKETGWIHGSIGVGNRHVRIVEV